MVTPADNENCHHVQNDHHRRKIKFKKNQHLYLLCLSWHLVLASAISLKNVIRRCSVKPQFSQHFRQQE